MILKMVLFPFWLLIELLIELFPNAFVGSMEWVQSAYLIKFGLYVLPTGFWSDFLKTVIVWTGTYFAWILIEWVYKKVPGVS